MTDRITRAEIVDLFGEAMPIEAAALLLNPPTGTTVASLREQLAAMAEKMHELRRQAAQASLTEKIARALEAGLEAQRDLPGGVGPFLFGDVRDGLEAFGIDGRVDLYGLADHVIGALQSTKVATGAE